MARAQLGERRSGKSWEKWLVFANKRRLIVEHSVRKQGVDGFADYIRMNGGYRAAVVLRADDTVDDERLNVSDHL